MPGRRADLYGFHEGRAAVRRSQDYVGAHGESEGLPGRIVAVDDREDVRVCALAAGPADRLEGPAAGAAEPDYDRGRANGRKRRRRRAPGNDHIVARSLQFVAQERLEKRVAFDDQGRPRCVLLHPFRIGPGRGASDGSRRIVRPVTAPLRRLLALPGGKQGSSVHRRSGLPRILRERAERKRATPR